ncbi:unnamed protein product [Peniophora sp. CBMAI 1063]|nr:unnamed protein product [Peniophora sp. CBMAI 1063]
MSGQVLSSSPLPSFGTNLSSLKLCGVLYPWGYQAPGLRRLEVAMHNNYFPDISETYNSVLSNVLDTLKNMKSLEELVLLDVIPPPLGALDGHDRLALPHLRVLKFRGIACNCAALWSLLDLPPDTTVVVSCCDVLLQTADLTLILQCLGSRFSHPTLPAYPGICIEEWDDDRRAGTLRLSIGSQTDCRAGSLTVSNYSRSARFDGTAIHLEMPSILDTLFDNIFCENYRQTVRDSFYDVATQLLAVVPKSTLETMAVVASNPSNMKREGISKLPVEEWERPCSMSGSMSPS